MARETTKIDGHQIVRVATGFVGRGNEQTRVTVSRSKAQISRVVRKMLSLPRGSLRGQLSHIGGDRYSTDYRTASGRLKFMTAYYED